MLTLLIIVSVTAVIGLIYYTMDYYDKHNNGGGAVA